MEGRKELRLELPGYIAVLLKDDINKTPINNIDAYSYDGTKMWNIREILESVLGNQKDEWYPEMSIVDGNLSVLAFRGIRYLIDGKTGELLGSHIVK